MAEEDQRTARETNVAGGDRREAERGEGSNDSRHKQMDSCICSEGIRFLERAGCSAYGRTPAPSPLAVSRARGQAGMSHRASHMTCHGLSERWRHRVRNLKRLGSPGAAE